VSENISHQAVSGNAKRAGKVTVDLNFMGFLQADCELRRNARLSQQ